MLKLQFSNCMLGIVGWAWWANSTG